MINHANEFQTSSWPLADGEAISMGIGPGPRVLGVTEGRVWLTVTGDNAQQDVWLEAGDSLDLPAGAHVVMEAWPAAHFQLLVPPKACQQVHRSARTAPASSLQRLLSSLQPSSLPQGLRRAA
jgi:uncharacterized protein YjlB